MTSDTVLDRRSNFHKMINIGQTKRGTKNYGGSSMGKLGYSPFWVKETGVISVLSHSICYLLIPAFLAYPAAG